MEPNPHLDVISGTAADVPAVRRSGLALGFQAIPFSHSVLSSAQIPESLSSFAVV
jgi:phosphoribosylcarboxyaminoimidazole (NCAIR) mutase